MEVWLSKTKLYRTAMFLFEHGLNRVWTGFVQWLFNGCSLVVQWLSPFVVFPGRRGKFLPRRGKFSPRRGKKSGCLVRWCVREDVWLSSETFFLSFVWLLHRRLSGEMADDEACGRKAGTAAAEESPIWFAHFSVIYANIWKKRKFIHLFLELCIELRSFADEK